MQLTKHIETHHMPHTNEPQSSCHHYVNDV